MQVARRVALDGGDFEGKLSIGLLRWRRLRRHRRGHLRGNRRNGKERGEQMPHVAQYTIARMATTKRSFTALAGALLFVMVWLGPPALGAAARSAKAAQQKP